MKRFLLFLVAIMAAGMSMMNASTCADLNAITGTVNNFSLGQVTVVYAKSPYYFVQDATGTTLVYKANYGLQAGDVVTGLSGKATLYNSLPELTNPTDYSSLSITQGTAPVIPDATVVPTMADINKVFMFRDVDMGGQSFRLNANNNPINLDVTFLGQTLQFRNGWKDTITFNANKTYDMVGAISRYNETLQVYVTDFVEHHEMGFNPIVVGAEKPSTWNAMYLYAWANVGGGLLGAWPGTLVNVDSAGWAYHTFEGVSEVNYIWNNGSGTQTEDLYTTASICQRLVEPQPHISSGHWTATTVDCTTHATQPSDTTSQDTIPDPGTGITLGFGNAFAWDSVYLYAWDDNQNPLLGQWPGTLMTLNENQWAYKTFTGVDKVNYIWSNGKNSNAIGARQTRDLTATASVCQAVDPYSANYPLHVVSIECDANPDYIFDLTYAQALAIGALADVDNPSYYTYRTTGVVSRIQTSPENVDQYKNCDFYIVNPNDSNDNSIQCFRTRWLQDTDMTSEVMPAVGDTVTIVGSLQYYQSRQVEFNRGYIESIARQFTPDTIAPQPQTGFTVKLLGMSVPAEWNEVRIYSWTPGVDSALSTGYGLQLTQDSLGWYSYTFQNVDTVDFLYNNGAWGETNQTIDARIISDVCVALGDPNTTPSGRYPLVAVDCIHPDTITPTPIDTGKICTVYIFDNITRVYYDSLKVQYGQDAVLPTESLPTYDGYHFVFWEGLYDGSNVIRNVKSDVYAQAKYYINLPEQTPANPVTVRLDPSSVPESWENVYVYSWTAGAMEAQWPGTAMTVDATGWLAYTFPAGVEDIDFLFNNGNGNTGNQTVDVDDVNSNYYFRIDNPLGPEGLYMVYPTQYTPQPDDTTGILVRFFSPQQMGWQSTKYIYAWVSADSVDTPILGEWPGQLMVADTATGWMTYRMPSQYTSVNVVINASDSYCQTEDILNITSDVCLGILNEQYEWYNEMCHYTPEVLDCAHSAKDYCRVVFADADNYIVAYRNVLSGDSVKNVPAGPERHGYDFIGWDKDLTNVTASMIVRPLYEEQPATTNLKVHLVPTNGIGWQQVYLYAWTNTPNGDFGYEVCGTWPGVQVPVDSLGWCTYTFAHDSLVNIIWNDGVSGENLIHQTANIMNVNTETYYRLFGTDEYSKAAVDVLNPLSNPSEFHTVAFIDYDFDAELLSIQQIHHGQNIIEWPNAPQHDGYTFLNWVQLDPVTMQATGIVTDTTSVTGDMIIDESYERVKYMVYMVDWDGRLLYFGEVPYGNNVNMEGLVPYYPREGYEFIGWSDSLQNITSMRFSVALYKPVTTGNYTVVYQGLNGQMIDRQMIDLMLPMAEEIDGYMFVGWKVVEGDLSYGTIAIQAMYQWVGPDGAPEVAGENRATKELREGKVYVISPDGKVYDAEGKLVETK